MANQTPTVVRLYATDESEATVVLEAQRQSRYPRRFLTMFPTNLAALSSLERPSCYFRVLMALLPILDPVQFRTASADRVARAAGMSLSSAARGLAMLEADRVILHSGRTANRERRLNNRLFWASKATAYDDAEPDPEILDSRGR